LRSYWAVQSRDPTCRHRPVCFRQARSIQKLSRYGCSSPKRPSRGSILEGRRRRDGLAPRVITTPLLGERKEVGHDPTRRLRRAGKLDVELGRVDVAVPQTQALRPGLRARTGRDHQVPARRRPLNLSAMTLHGLEFARQTRKRRVTPEEPHRELASLKLTRRVVAARFPARVPDVGVEGRFRIQRVATMRAVPGMVHTVFAQERQSLCPAARRPERQVPVAEHLLSAAPPLPVHLAPVFEVPRQETAERLRFGGQEGFVEVPQPHLLRPDALPSGTGPR